MILTEDIEKVVKVALDAQAVFTGKSHPNRGPDAPAHPYVVFFCSVVQTEHTSGPQYHQWWRVRAAAYALLGTTPAILDVLKGLATALVTGTSGTPPVVASLRNPGEAVLSVVIKDTEEEYDEQVREGQDVLVASLEVELLCLGDRSVA